MIAEAINALHGLFHSAQGVDFHTHHKTPKKLYIREPGGELRIEDAPAPLRLHRIDGLDDLVAILKHAGKAPEVFFGEHVIHAFLDGSDRREGVLVDLRPTVRWQRIVKLEALGWGGEPRAAVKMLRFDLHSIGCQSTIDGLSRIDFTRHSTGKSHVQHGSESLGQSVEAQVQQADKVPQDFEVSVPVWTAPGFDRLSVTVKCGTFIDVHERRVEIRVLADETAAALGRARDAAASNLREQLGDIPVFLGEPKHGSLLQDAYGANQNNDTPF